MNKSKTWLLEEYFGRFNELDTYFIALACSRKMFHDGAKVFHCRLAVVVAGSCLTGHSPTEWITRDIELRKDLKRKLGTITSLRLLKSLR